MTGSTDGFHRFSISERVQHLLLVTTVTLLALTGLPQKFSSTDWAPIMVQWMGGIDVVRIIHRINAFVLTAGVLYHVGNAVYRLITKRANFDMKPQAKDFKDFTHNIAYFLGIKKDRPRFDRFNFIEKFEYWAVLWGMVMMAVTGLILWFPALVTRFLSGYAVPVAKAAHSGEAFLAVAAVVLWHLYNAHFSPKVFPFNQSIVNGKISQHEMMVEHPLEYERITGEPVPEEVLNQPVNVPWYTLVTSGLVGMMVVGLFVVLLNTAINPPDPELVPPMYDPLERQIVLAAPEIPNLPASVLWIGSGKLPVADFEALPAKTSSAARSFLFNDLSQGDVSSRLWDFGDGTTSNEQNPTHTYASICPTGGLCTVSLTVCGPGGCDTELKSGFIQLP